MWPDETNADVEPGDEALSAFDEEQTSEQEHTILPNVTRRSFTGWLVGILCGVLIGLWRLPPVRYTLASQLQFALESDGAPWTHPLNPRPTRREIALLDTTATSDQQDYLLQVGRATALADAGGLRTEGDHAPNAPNTLDDRTLVRLTVLASDFPGHPGACAHLARYMMVDRIRLQRAELTPERSGGGQRGGRVRLRLPASPQAFIPAGHRDVRLMEWTLRRGEQLAPTNAFWPAMLAATYFAAGRDQAGLKELSRIRQTGLWDAYIYEQVLGQWRLYSLAYGDHGAAQKIEPLSLVAFPQLREMRHTAELARGLADRAEAEGDDLEAIRIRHDLARLGQIMRDTAPWAYEALYGTELLFIASTDRLTSTVHSPILSVQEWRAQAKSYLDLLARNGRRSEIAWITDQVQQSCKLRQAVDQARSDASLPGIPPGIPLAALFGDWMVGVCLIQQALALIVATATAVIWMRWGNGVSGRLRRYFWAGLVVIVVSSGILLVLDASSTSLTLTFLSGAVLLLLIAGQRLIARRQTDQSAARELSGSLPFREVQGVRLNSPPSLARHERPGKGVGGLGRSDWNAAVIARILVLTLLPGLFMLHLMEPALGRMHPVAMLLTHLVIPVKAPQLGDALRDALAVGGLPLALVLAAGYRGAIRGQSPLLWAQVGLRRMALPALVCLMGVYLLQMQRTLRLDALCSQAINEAARNDRQWVLTHTETDADSEE